MPNGFAYLTLVLWPMLTVALFLSMPVRQAILWSLFGGFLLLPMHAAIDLPLVPPFNKVTLPSIAAFACVLFLTRERLELVPRSPLARVLVVVVLVTPFFTALTNGDRLAYGPTTLPGLTLHDALSSVATAFIGLIPFLLARHFFATTDGHRMILRVFLFSGLAYSLLMLFEMRMSPQLHMWIYGFFQHTWMQMVRFGGFRPIVFMQHGLEVALYALLVAGAAITLWRTAEPVQRVRLGLMALYLVVVMILCRTLTAWAYSLLLLPLLAFAAPRLQIRTAVVLSAMVVCFPLLRGADLFPTDTLVDTAAIVSEVRAGSLDRRFLEEDKLLEKAAQRPLFGWGSWGRFRIYDVDTGRDESVTDGAWVTTFGSSGVFGFFGTFGLLALPIVLLWARARDRLPLETAGLALLLAINLVDLLPNSSLWPITWLVAGALTGYAESLAPVRTRRRKAGAGRARPGRAPPSLPEPEPDPPPATSPAARRRAARGLRQRGTPRRAR